MGAAGPQVWVSFGDGPDGVSVRDTVVNWDSNAWISLTALELGGSDNPTGDVLDLSELRNPENDAITIDDIDMHFNKSSGQFYNAFLTIPTGSDGEDVYISMTHLDFGYDNGNSGPNMSVEEFLTRIGIPA